MRIMKSLRAWTIVVCLIAGCAAPSVLHSSSPSKQSDGGWTVVRVTDGDTFIVQNDAGKRERVRLRRVNAPELDEPGGPEARDALEAALLGKRIKLTIYARDKWGRIIAEIPTE